MMRRGTCWGRAPALLVLGWLGTATASEIAPAARLVAPDALLYIEVTTPATLLDRTGDERVRGVLDQSPQFQKALKQNDLKRFRQAADFVSDQLDTTWDQALRDLSGGGIVLAVEGKTKPERIFVVVTPRDPAFLSKTHAKLVELARKDAADKENPDPIQQGEHRGIVAYSLNKNEAHAIVDGKLIVANGSEALKSVVDRVLDKPETSIVDDANWKSCQSKLGPDTLAWAFARLDRIRQIDKKYVVPDRVNPGATFLFGPWIEAYRKAPWISASLTWTEGRLAADVTMPAPPGGYSEAMKRYVPSTRAAAPSVLRPPGTIASLSLWRDLAAIWEVRADILPPEAVQGLAQLDTQAGTFFGGRDFGTGVLGALTADWRLVVARQEPSTLDPVPDVKLPAFALVIGLKGDDADFAVRLKAAFQSFIGLANLGAAQTKAPPLMLGSETLDGVAISTARFLSPRQARPKDEPVHQRHNFSPSAAQVGDQFILSSSLGLTKDLIRTIQDPGPPTDSTLLVEADGGALAGVLEQNKARLVMQNMLEKGNDKAKAEGEFDVLAALVRYLGRGAFTVQDRPDALQFRLDFQLNQKP